MGAKGCKGCNCKNKEEEKNEIKAEEKEEKKNKDDDNKDSTNIPAPEEKNFVENDINIKKLSGNDLDSNGNINSGQRELLYSKSEAKITLDINEDKIFIDKNILKKNLSERRINTVLNNQLGTFKKLNEINDTNGEKGEEDLKGKPLRSQPNRKKNNFINNTETIPDKIEGDAISEKLDDSQNKEEGKEENKKEEGKEENKKEEGKEENIPQNNIPEGNIIPNDTNPNNVNPINIIPTATNKENPITTNEEINTAMNINVTPLFGQNEPSAILNEGTNNEGFYKNLDDTSKGNLMLADSPIHKHKGKNTEKETQNKIQFGIDNKDNLTLEEKKLMDEAQKNLNQFFAPEKNEQNLIQKKLNKFHMKNFVSSGKINDEKKESEEDELIFHGELKKLINYEINAHKPQMYSSRFFTLTTKYLFYYKSKENFLMKQKPLFTVPLTEIVKVSFAKVKKTSKKIDHIIICNKMGILSKKKFSQLKAKGELNKDNFNIFSKESQESLLIVTSEIEEFIYKWYIILDYMVNKAKQLAEQPNEEV
ncbi:MAG: hypothetical protein MJ252_02965 [archaeon]|nr:hypothetical protein [archaeon]